MIAYPIDTETETDAYDPFLFPMATYSNRRKRSNTIRRVRPSRRIKMRYDPRLRFIKRRVSKSSTPIVRDLERRKKRRKVTRKYPPLRGTPIKPGDPIHSPGGFNIKRKKKITSVPKEVKQKDPNRIIFTKNKKVVNNILSKDSKKNDLQKTTQDKTANDTKNKMVNIGIAAVVGVGITAFIAFKLKSKIQAHGHTR